MEQPAREDILDRRLASGPALPAEARRTLAIIGTAGRNDDAPRLSKAAYDRMCDAARAMVRLRGYTHLVSGGAAWADHVAVTLALEGTVPVGNLTLHLPAPLRDGRYDEDAKDGRTANHYHRLFRARSGIDGLAELASATALGAMACSGANGFLARNADVARDGTGVLAFTFGTGTPWRAKVHGCVTARTAMLKPGGTSDTWNKSRAAEKVHVCLAPMEGSSA